MRNVLVVAPTHEPICGNGRKYGDRGNNGTSGTGMGIPGFTEGNGQGRGGGWILWLENKSDSDGDGSGRSCSKAWSKIHEYVPGDE